MMTPALGAAIKTTKARQATGRAAIAAPAAIPARSRLLHPRPMKTPVASVVAAVVNIGLAAAPPALPVPAEAPTAAAAKIKFLIKKGLPARQAFFVWNHEFSRLLQFFEYFAATP